MIIIYIDTYRCVLMIIIYTDAYRCVNDLRWVRINGYCLYDFFFNWYSLNARLNSHYEAWSYKKRKHKKVKAYRKSI